MSCKRILLLVGGCLLAAAGARADDLGYVDCSNHADDTPVFAKARKSPDQVGTVACGERFTVLLNGFIFSRIETKDGKIGYIYSNYISVDHGATAASIRQPDTGKMVEATSKVVIPADKPAQPKPAPAPARTMTPQTGSFPQPAQSTVAAAATTPAVPDAATASASSTVSTTTSTPDQAVSAAPSPSQPPAVQATPTEVVVAAPATGTPAASTTTDTTAPATTAAPAASPAPEPPASTPDAPVKSEEAQPAAAPQPQPAAVAQPEPPAPTPAAPIVTDPRVRESWEKPNPGARKPFAIELYGGYAFTRFSNGNPASNFNGAMGAFAWNFKPWLQLAGDSTYSYANISGTKNVLYGNHYGPRYFIRRATRWGLTPFVEGLVGGTRADTTVSGPNGYTTSANCISYKVGGGVDMHTSRHIEVRLVDFDYYRTAFGTNLHQNNYWFSTGIVLQLFGGGRE